MPNQQPSQEIIRKAEAFIKNSPYENVHIEYKGIYELSECFLLKFENSENRITGIPVFILANKDKIEWSNPYHFRKILKALNIE